MPDLEAEYGPARRPWQFAALRFASAAFRGRLSLPLARTACIIGDKEGTVPMTMAATRPAALDPRQTIERIPRDYNFAADVLERNLAAGRADKAAFIDPRGSWTYGALADRVARFGHVLRSLGMRQEERIMLALLDTIDWPTAFLGAIKAGVIPIPVNTLMTEEDYRFMLADSRAKLLVVSEPLFGKFANLIGAKGDLAAVVVSGDNAHGQLRFEDLLNAAPAEPFTAPTTRDDMCFWLYTSGSTGRPKGAV